MAKTSEKGAPATPPVRPHPECALSELRTTRDKIFSFFHEAPHGVSLDDVMRPGYWRNVWRQLGRERWTEIVVIAVDGTWEARLRVTAVGEGFARTRCVSLWTADEPADKENLPTGWKVEFAGTGWRVRNDAGEIVTAGHALADEAVAKALGFIKQLLG